MVLPPGSSFFARSWSTWIHCSSQVASAAVDTILSDHNPFARADLGVDRGFEFTEVAEDTHVESFLDPVRSSFPERWLE
jgi:hypothetical protein